MNGQVEEADPYSRQTGIGGPQPVWATGMQTMEARRPAQQEQTHDNQSGGRFYTRCPTCGEKGRNWWSEMVDRQYLTYTHIYIIYIHGPHTGRNVYGMYADV
jgi:hypothetical protein